jgi:tetratricopeptide (TPR) repeat protein
VGALYVAVTGGSRGIGPAAASAGEAATGIAVLPFQATGPSLELYREGMVDLMSANLDGLSGYRAIDSRTVLSRWARATDEAENVDLEGALRVAGATGARFAVVGSGVEVGSRIRFTADIYDLDTGEKIGDGQVEGSPEEVLTLVDALTVEVMRSFLEATGQPSATQNLRLASVLTQSVPALRAYLEGDADYRRADFVAAEEHFLEAVQEDSTFALAHWRLSDTYGWLESIRSERVGHHGALAARYSDRLPPREATILDLSQAVRAGRAMQRLEEFEAFVERHPDDPDGWYLLGEIALHDDGPPGVSDERLEEILYRTVELDPSFAPYYSHALEWATARGDSARAEELLRSWTELGLRDPRLEAVRVRADLLLGDASTRAAALARLPDLTDWQLLRISQSAAELTDHGLPMLEAVARERIRRGADAFNQLQRLLTEQGRYQELLSLADRRSTPWLRLSARRTAIVQLMDEWHIAREAVARATMDSVRALPEDAAPEFSRTMVISNLYTVLGDSEGWRRVTPGPETPEWASLVDLVGGVEQFRRFYDVAMLSMDQDWPAALRGLKEVPGICYEVSALPVCGKIAFKAGDLAAAERYYGGLLRADVGRSVAQYHLGRIAEERGDDASALNYYRSFLQRMERADTELPALDHARAFVAARGE